MSVEIQESIRRYLECYENHSKFFTVGSDSLEALHSLLPDPYLASAGRFGVIADTSDEDPKYCLIFPLQEAELRPEEGTVSLSAQAIVLLGEHCEGLAAIGYHTLFATPPKAQGITESEYSDSFEDLIASMLEGAKPQPIGRCEQIGLNHIADVLRSRFLET